MKPRSLVKQRTSACRSSEREDVAAALPNSPGYRGTLTTMGNTVRTARLRPLLLLLPSLLLVVLAACAPASEAPRVDVQQLTEPISYYPFQAGARWAYLPDRARLTDPTTLVQVEGPTILGSEVWVAWHSRGRGLDQMSYRQIKPTGVFLGREERLGTTFSFDPPLQEYPAEGQLRVGAQWSGNTTVSMSIDEGKQRRDMELDYSYTVVDKRLVTVPAGEFEVFVIDFVSRTYDENGDLTEEFSRQSWFAPYIGEVRTQAGHVLVSSNAIEAEKP